jgi:hypothetical protein
LHHRKAGGSAVAASWEAQGARHGAVDTGFDLEDAQNLGVFQCFLRAVNASEEDHEALWCVRACVACVVVSLLHTSVSSSLRVYSRRDGWGQDGRACGAWMCFFLFFFLFQGFFFHNKLGERRGTVCESPLSSPRWCPPRGCWARAMSSWRLFPHSPRDSTRSTYTILLHSPSFAATSGNLPDLVVKIQGVANENVDATGQRHSAGAHPGRVPTLSS